MSKAMRIPNKSDLEGHECEICNHERYSLWYSPEDEEFFVGCRNCGEFLALEYIKQIERERIEDEREDLIDLYERKRKLKE